MWLIAIVESWCYSRLIVEQGSGMHKQTFISLFQERCLSERVSVDKPTEESASGVSPPVNGEQLTFRGGKTVTAERESSDQRDSCEKYLCWPSHAETSTRSRESNDQYNSNAAFGKTLTESRESSDATRTHLSYLIFAEPG